MMTRQRRATAAARRRRPMTREEALARQERQQHQRVQDLRRMIRTDTQGDTAVGRKRKG